MFKIDNCSKTANMNKKTSQFQLQRLNNNKYHKRWCYFCSTVTFLRNAIQRNASTVMASHKRPKQIETSIFPFPAETTANQNSRRQCRSNFVMACAS